MPRFALKYHANATGCHEMPRFLVFYPLFDASKCHGMPRFATAWYYRKFLYLIDITRREVFLPVLRKPRSSLIDIYIENILSFLCVGKRMRRSHGLD